LLTRSWQELHDAVLAVAGIAATEIEPRPGGGPFVRVWLDGARNEADVAGDVRRVLAEAGYGTRGVDRPQSAQEEAEVRPPRRPGLGRGLEALIPPAEPEPATKGPRRLRLVAVEETTAGTKVRAVDGGGVDVMVAAPPGADVNAAVVAAVASLLGVAAPQLDAVEVRDMGATMVMIVVITDPSGRRASGSAIVEAGMPFTLGRAVWSAIQALG
jgi:hypothetical protein